MTMTESILTKIQTNFDDHAYYNSALVGLFRQHVESKYPNSKHWNPDKI